MEGIKHYNTYNPEATDNVGKVIRQIPEWTNKTAEKIKRHSQEIKELEEKITSLEKVNEVNAAENTELKGEINGLKEQIELLKEEIKKITEKQNESELIAQIQQEQPPAYKKN